MTTTETTLRAAIGAAVITMAFEGVFTYAGPSDNSVESMTIGTRPHPLIHTGSHRVAPADIPVPAKDARVKVEKIASRYLPRPGRPWRLTLPGAHRTTYHETKRDAVAAGCRRLAIADWHTAND